MMYGGGLPIPFLFGLDRHAARGRVMISGYHPVNSTLKWFSLREPTLELPELVSGRVLEV